jgi:hypothetical protein
MINSEKREAERIAKLEARIAQLEANTPERMPRDRRAFLKSAGIAAAGAVGLSTLHAGRAAATDGASLIVGQNNTTATQTSLNSTETNGNTILEVGSVGATTGSLDAVHGHANSDTSAWGVYGEAFAGVGVRGDSSTGIALEAAGNGRLHLVSHGSAVPNAAGSYLQGEIARNSTGDMYVCVTGGSPGTWRKVAGPGTAGQLHFITPTRAYASDVSGGVISSSNTPRTVSLATAVPAGARAAVFNLTVFNTYQGGYLTVYNADLASPPGVNSVQWYQSNQFITVTTLSEVNAARSIKANVYAGSLCHFQIDVLGYYL